MWKKKREIKIHNAPKGRSHDWPSGVWTALQPHLNNFLVANLFSVALAIFFFCTFERTTQLCLGRISGALQ